MTTGAQGSSSQPRWTVGSLFGQPQHTAPAPAASEAPAQGAESVPQGELEGRWVVRSGRLAPGGGGGFDEWGTERLDYNNPFGQSVERVWFDGKIVFAVDVGEVEVDPERVKVAQEYEIVYSVQLDESGKLISKEHVPGQLNIYDSVPGMGQYSPIWQFNYVVVPRSYTPNTLRSEADCLGSGYQIVKSNVFEN